MNDDDLRELRALALSAPLYDERALDGRKVSPEHFRHWGNGWTVGLSANL
jgi:hypothetical protein